MTSWLVHEGIIGYKPRMIIFNSVSRILFFVLLVTICENFMKKYYCSEAFVFRPVNTKSRIFTSQLAFRNKILGYRAFTTNNLNSIFNKPESYSPTAIKGGKVDYIKSNGKSTKKFILVTGGVISGIGKPLPVYVLLV